jgi:hypothetical protein
LISNHFLGSFLEKCIFRLSLRGWLAWSDVAGASRPLWRGHPARADSFRRSLTSMPPCGLYVPPKAALLILKDFLGSLLEKRIFRLSLRGWLAWSDVAWATRPLWWRGRPARAGSVAALISMPPCGHYVPPESGFADSKRLPRFVPREMHIPAPPSRVAWVVRRSAGVSPAVAWAYCPRRFRRRRYLDAAMRPLLYPPKVALLILNDFLGSFLENCATGKV